MDRGPEVDHPRAVAVGVASRPHPEESICGDIWTVDWRHGICRVAIVDGLGHGPLAWAAAEAARESLAAHPELNCIDSLRLCHLALKGTRGAAMSLALIDPANDRLTFAGVGNVDGRLIVPGKTHRLTPDRGIVGSTFPTVRPIELHLPARWHFALFSDGIGSRFALPLSGDEPALDLTSLAHQLLLEWARKTDDATVLIACLAP